MGFRACVSAGVIAKCQEQVISVNFSSQRTNVYKFPQVQRDMICFPDMKLESSWLNVLEKIAASKNDGIGQLK